MISTQKRIIFGAILLAGVVALLLFFQTLGGPRQGAARIEPRIAADLPRVPAIAPVPVASIASAAPTPLARSAATPGALDSQAQTSLTIVVRWADTREPAAGTSITLYGWIGEGNAGFCHRDFDVAGAVVKVHGWIAGQPAPWTKSAIADARGVAKVEFPEAFDALTVFASQPSAAVFMKTFDRRPGSTRDTALPHGWLADPLVVDLDRGGKVFGTVRRAADGRPVAGAEIDATPVVPPHRDAYPSGTTAFPPAISVRAGADGRFEVGGLAPGLVVLSASGGGLFSDASKQAPFNLAAGNASGPHDVLLYAGGTLSGRVTARQGGTPLSGATVAVKFQNLVLATAISREDGFYKIEGIPFGLFEDAIALLPGYATESTVLQIDSAETAKLDFQLGQAGRLEATVRDESGNPLQGAMVAVKRANQAGRFRNVYTGADGRAVLDDVALFSPDQRLIIQKIGYLPKNGAEVPEFDDQGIARVEAVLEKMRHVPANFFGTVADSFGKPLAGIKVADSASFGGDANSQSATTGADGSYRLGPIEISANSAPRLIASGAGWAKSVCAAKPADDANMPVRVDFTMHPAHWAAGRVVDDQKHPLPGVRVRVEQDSSSLGTGMGITLGEAQLDSITAITDANGGFRVENLPDGRYTAYTDSPLIPYSVSVPLTLELVTEIVIHSAGIIRGRVIDAQSKQPVTRFTLSVGANSGYSLMTRAERIIDDPDGRFVIDNIDSRGLNSVSVVSAGYARLTRDRVPAEDPRKPDPAKELVFELQPAKPLAIALTDKNSGAPVAGASVIVATLSGNRNDTLWDYLVTEASRPMIGGQFLTTGPDGTVVAPDAAIDATILISAPGHPNLRIRPSGRDQYAAPSGVLTIPLARSGSISGVAYLDGAVAAGRTLELQGTASPSVGIQILGNTLADASGRFKFKDLPAGEYDLRVAKSNGQTRWTALAKSLQLAESQDLTVNIGDDIGASALFGTLAQGGKPVAARAMELHPAFPSSYKTSGTLTASDGSYKILGLAPGAYRLDVGPGGEYNPSGNYGPTSFKVVVGPAPTQHDIELSPMP